MRATAVAAAIIFAFLGVMYVRFSGDAVPQPESSPSPVFGSSRIVAYPAQRSILVPVTTPRPLATIVPDGRRPDFVVVDRGPFVRVVNTDNTCLNIRAAPDPSADILDCAAEGVLLQLSGQLADDANGVRWRSVTTPSGIEGWASTQYLATGDR